MSKIPTIAMIPSGYKANKVYSVLPTNGDGDLTFSRSGDATRVNQLGLIETVATGVPRLDYSDGGCPSLLVEPARKNLFLNSQTGVTQTITVVSGVDYAVSFSGTGSITFSGGATGTLNGTGANAVDRVFSIITTTTTSVTCTISGTVEYVNFEINTDNSSVSYATSYIPTNGATATRSAETSSKTGLGSYINSSEGVLYFEGSALANDGTLRFLALSDGTNNNRVFILYSSTSNLISCQISTSLGTAPSALSFTTNTTNINKIAFKYKVNDFALWVNGVEVDSTQVGDTPINLSRLGIDRGINSNTFYGKIKDVRVYNQALTDSELALLTSL